MNSRKLLVWLIASSILSPMAACSKKKSSHSAAGVATEVAEADEDTRFSTSVPNGALAITSIDIIGASAANGSTGLRLATAEYDTDSQRTNVYDPAMDAMSQAGNIICFFNQANYLDMIDQGPYVAQANMKSCFKEDGGGDSGQSSGAAKELTTLYVESTRVDEYSPLIAKIWFTMEENKGDNGSVMKVDMQMKMIVAEGQSETNPIGIFKLAWEGKVSGETIMKGFIETKRSAEEGKISLNMVDSSAHGDKSETTAGAAELSYDTILKEVTGGVVHTSTPVWDNNTPSTQEFGAAFNDNFFLRSNITKSKTACLAKDEYDYSVYRYGLYSATDGSRVDRASGFPITVESAGQKVYGWAGYWGLWLPPSVDLVDGLTVTQNDRAAAGATYSVKVGPGKLIKKTRLEITLTELKGIELNANGQYVISYDGTSFKQIGTQNQGNTTYTTPTAYSIQDSWRTGQAGSINLYSQALGGQVIVYYDAAGTPTSPAYYYKEENVTANAGDLDLVCLQQCLQPSITSAQLSGNPWDQNATSADSPFFVVSNTDRNANWNNPTALKALYQKDYHFDGTSMTLKYSGTAVTLASGVSLSGNNSWGLQSGPLVTASVAATITNPWDIYSSSVYYQWETGSNAWNKFIAIRDANGTAVAFEAPLFMTYTHAAANDRSGAADGPGAKFYDKKMLLQYQGFGQLQGIPSTNDENNHYAPLFAIKDGVLAGDTNQYKIKALDMEVRMKIKADTECAALSIGTLPTLPSISSHKSPDLGTAPDLVGAAPAVIEGVIQ